MRTVGIDFASQPKNTALCEIVWDGSSATVVQVASHVTDDQIRAMVLAPPSQLFGVDTPFGWPERFVEFVRAHQERLTPPAVAMEQLRLRETDRFIWSETGKVPLAVAADKIAIPAMRWAVLLAEFGVQNRAGDGNFFEVYPAAARITWGLPAKDNAAALEVILAECTLSFASAEYPQALLRNEHAFDALICALATRAAALGLSYPPPPNLQAVAEVEGWIHAPQPGSLDQLIDAGLA